jgi:hypothetical protein
MIRKASKIEITEAVGGGEQLNDEIYFGVVNASWRRYGIPASFVELKREEARGFPESVSLMASGLIRNSD